MAARRWTPEQRKRQAELIRRWRPWLHATGPRTEAGKQVVARHADRGGQRPELRSLAVEIGAMLAELQALLAEQKALTPEQERGQNDQDIKSRD